MKLSLSQHAGANLALIKEHIVRQVSSKDYELMLLDNTGRQSTINEVVDFSKIDSSRLCEFVNTYLEAYWQTARKQRTKLWYDEETPVLLFEAFELSMREKKFVDLFTLVLETQDLGHEVHQNDLIEKIVEKWRWSPEVARLIGGYCCLGSQHGHESLDGFLELSGFYHEDGDLDVRVLELALGFSVGFSFSEIARKTESFNRDGAFVRLLRSDEINVYIWKALMIEDTELCDVLSKNQLNKRFSSLIYKRFLDAVFHFGFSLRQDLFAYPHMYSYWNLEDSIHAKEEDTLTIGYSDSLVTTLKNIALSICLGFIHKKLFIEFSNEGEQWTDIEAILNDSQDAEQEVVSLLCCYIHFYWELPSIDRHPLSYDDETSVGMLEAKSIAMHRVEYIDLFSQVWEINGVDHDVIGSELLIDLINRWGSVPQVHKAMGLFLSNCDPDALMENREWMDIVQAMDFEKHAKENALFVEEFARNIFNIYILEAFLRQTGKKKVDWGRSDTLHKALWQVLLPSETSPFRLLLNNLRVEELFISTLLAKVMDVWRQLTVDGDFPSVNNKSKLFY